MIANNAYNRTSLLERVSNAQNDWFSTMRRRFHSFSEDIHQEKCELLQRIRVLEILVLRVRIVIQFHKSEITALSDQVSLNDKLR